jgi:hypothetical protein
LGSGVWTVAQLKTGASWLRWRQLTSSEMSECETDTGQLIHDGVGLFNLSSARFRGGGKGKLSSDPSSSPSMLRRGRWTEGALLENEQGSTPSYGSRSMSVITIPRGGVLLDMDPEKDRREVSPPRRCNVRGEGASDLWSELLSLPAARLSERNTLPRTPCLWSPLQSSPSAGESSLPAPLSRFRNRALPETQRRHPKQGW